MIDSVNNLVAEAQRRHFTQWPILGTYVWPNPQPIPATYAGEISSLKNWLTLRLKWIDENLTQTGPCSTWPTGATGTMAFKMANPVTDFNAAFIAVKKSQKIYLRIIDLNGRIVASSSIMAIQGNNSFPNANQLNTLQRSVYFIQAFNDAGKNHQ